MKTRDIVKAWLLVGTLDLSAATIQTLIMGGTVERLLRFISSGLFGLDAMTGGFEMLIAGVAIHYCIAFAWTVVFFAVPARSSWVRAHWVWSGILYGGFIWNMMNHLVLPLTHITPRPFDLTRALIGAGILMLAIGIPLAWINHRKN